MTREKKFKTYFVSARDGYYFDGDAEQIYGLLGAKIFGVEAAAMKFIQEKNLHDMNPLIECRELTETERNSFEMQYDMRMKRMKKEPPKS